MNQQLPSDLLQIRYPEFVRNLELPAIGGCDYNHCATSPLIKFCWVPVRIEPHRKCQVPASPQKALNKPSKIFLKADFGAGSG